MLKEIDPGGASPTRHRMRGFNTVRGARRCWRSHQLAP